KPKQQLDSIHGIEQEIRAQQGRLKEGLTYLYHSWEAETVEAVQSALPPNGVLVEFKLYRPFDAKATKNGERWAKHHYVAYVLHAVGDPQAKDLGSAEAIDSDVNTLRREFQNDNEDLSVSRVK